MKTSIFTFLIILAAIFCTAQNETVRMDCEPPSATTELDVNQLRIKLVQYGTHEQYSVEDANAGDNNPTTVFASSLWGGAFDPSGNLKLAANRYQGHDFYPGPLDPATGLADFTACTNWDRFFIILLEDVQKLESLFQLNSLSEDLIPESVKQWPAFGNPFFEEANDFSLPDGQAMAGFWDENADGIFNPLDGDFPLINGAISPTNRQEALASTPNKLIFWVFNDAGGQHSQTNGAQMNIEIHGQAFAYKKEGILNQTTFHHFTIFNRGQTDLRAARFGIWADPDLGCYTDDKIGCNPDMELSFVYNEDANDGTYGCECNGYPTFCDSIPVYSTGILSGVLTPKNISYDSEGNIVLNDVLPPIMDFDTLVDEKMSSFIAHSNCGIVDPPPATCGPNTAAEYFSYLNGKWLDGTPLTYGGYGYNPGSTDTTLFMYPDDPSTEGWHHCDIPLPSNLNTIMSSGNTILQPGARTTLFFNNMITNNVPHPCPDLGLVYDAQDSIIHLFQNNFQIQEGVFSSNSELTHIEEIQLFPNPYTGGDLIIKNLPKECTVVMYNLQGKLILKIPLSTTDYYDGNQLKVPATQLNIDNGTYIISVKDIFGQTIQTGKWVHLR